MPKDETDPDFEHICAYMYAKGYEHIPTGGFISRDDRDGEIVYCSFEDAAADWHTAYIEQVRAINHAEMWRE